MNRGLLPGVHRSRPADAGSALVVIPVLEAPHSQTNWNTIVNNASAYGATYRQTDSSAIGSQITWDVWLSAGVWELSGSFVKFTNGGIITVSTSPNGIDYTTHGDGIDTYNGSTTFKNIMTLPGMVIAANGYHRLKFDMISKNALSTNYLGTIENLPMQMRRTDVPLG